MKKVLFLDLEETIINDWWSRKLVNVHKLRKYIRLNSISTIGIFSFAIFDDNDRKDFSDNMHSWLEEVLEVTISDELIPTVEDVVKIVSHQKRILPLITARDFFDFFDKRSAFEYYCTNDYRFADHKCTLIDDAVKNTRLILDDREIITINVDTSI